MTSVLILRCYLHSFMHVIQLFLILLWIDTSYSVVLHIVMLMFRFFLCLTSVWLKWTLLQTICSQTIKMESLYNMFTFFIINEAAGDNIDDTICGSLRNPIENL